MRPRATTKEQSTNQQGPFGLGLPNAKSYYPSLDNLKKLNAIQLSDGNGNQSNDIA